MELHVLIFNKKNNNIKKEKIITLFNQLFKLRDNILEINNLKIKCEFIENEKEKVLLIKFTTLKKSFKEAKTFCELKKILQNGEHRKEININFAYDESAKYYCEKLYPLIGQFERKLRYLIYFILLKSFGVNWVKEVLYKKYKEEKLKEKTKGKSENQLIDNALEDFTFSDYIDFLFIEYTEFTAEEIVFKIKQDKDNAEKYIEKNKKISLWNRYFVDIKIDNLQEIITKIKNIRNKVMHNKEVTYNEFKEYKEILLGVIKELEKAILDVETTSYNYDKTEFVLYSYNQFMKSSLNVPSSFKELYLSIKQQQIEAKEILGENMFKINEEYQKTSTEITQLLQDIKFKLPKMNIEIPEGLRNSIQLIKEMKAKMPRIDIEYPEITEEIRQLGQDIKIKTSMSNFKSFEKIRQLSQENQFRIPEIPYNETLNKLKELSELNEYLYSDRIYKKLENEDKE